jgi:hypothetical protein
MVIGIRSEQHGITLWIGGDGTAVAPEPEPGKNACDLPAGIAGAEEEMGAAAAVAAAEAGNRRAAQPPGDGTFCGFIGWGAVDGVE